jgi:hypothetical protein
MSRYADLTANWVSSALPLKETLPPICFRKVNLEAEVCRLEETRRTLGNSLTRPSFLHRPVLYASLKVNTGENARDLAVRRIGRQEGVLGGRGKDFKKRSGSLEPSVFKSRSTVSLEKPSLFAVLPQFRHVIANSEPHKPFRKRSEPINKGSLKPSKTSKTTKCSSGTQTEETSIDHSALPFSRAQFREYVAS